MCVCFFVVVVVVVFCCGFLGVVFFGGRGVGSVTHRELNL